MPPLELTARLDRLLDALDRAHPEARAAIALQGALVRAGLARVREPEVRRLPLPRQRVARKVREGIPLLHEEAVYVDVRVAADLFGRLAGIVAEQGEPEARRRASWLAAALDGGRVDLERVIVEAFVQHRDHLHEIALHADVDPDLLQGLALQAVVPLLRGYGARLAPLLERANDGSSWEKGYCPVCGAWPLLGHTGAVRSGGHLRCSACGVSWRTRHAFCPYCGAGGFREMTGVRVEGEQGFTVRACGRCLGYLKVRQGFDPPPAQLLALDDLASIDLDRAAVERGYRRPASTGFRLELAVAEEEWAEDLASLDVD